MALPTLNSTRYSTTVPSTGQEIEFRPFLVKEEKILMVAMESKDPKLMIKGLKDILTACVFDDIDVDRLTNFDLEELFLRLRSKSVGEKVNVNLKCSECGAMTPQEINLDDVKTEGITDNRTVMMTDTVGIEFDYPSLDLISGMDYSEEDFTTEEQVAITMKLIKSCIKSIFDDDNVWDVKDQSDKEIESFLDGLNAAQFTAITEYFGNIPTLAYTVNYNCIKCGHANEIQLKGIQSFFI